MVYDEGLAQRVRQLMEEMPSCVEKKMFGGVGFMLHGNMACGVNGDDLIVRVGKENNDQALSRPHARPFDFTGRPMRGWVLVSPEGYQTEGDLEGWVQMGVDFAQGLPSK